MKINIGIAENNLSEVVTVLTRLLSDEYILYTKTRNYHWNVTGRDFMELHKFFESQYEALDEIIDEIAERIRSLGDYSPGSLKSFLENARLEEDSKKDQKPEIMLSNLLADHESVIRNTRNDIYDVGEKYKDAGTNDFLTGLLEQHEKMAWMLRAYLS